MRLEQMKITPDQAADWLRSLGEPGNRRLSPRRVELYADEMRAGRWRLTVQGISITRDGVIVDGQHRLAAVVDYGAPVEFVVDVDADPSSFPMMDAGRSRSGQDALHIAGYVNTSQLHAGARLLWLIDQYVAGDQTWQSVRSRAISPARMLEYLGSPEGQYVQDAMPVAQRVAQQWGRWGAKTPLTVAVAMLSRARVPNDLRSEFVERCADGAMLAQRSPILALRRYFIGETGWIMQNLQGRSLIGAAVIVKAYNAWALQEDLLAMRYSVDREPFPIPVSRSDITKAARERERAAEQREAADG